MTRREQAMAYFKQGFNCSQSVLRAYSDLFDMPEDELMKAGQSFGCGWCAVPCPACLWWQVP